MVVDSPLIVALDVPDEQEALRWVQRLAEHVTVFKVGMQLFYRSGPEIVRRVQGVGGQVFLDLKLHDIPNTVAKACESLLDLEVRFITVHTSGGLEMLSAAQSVVEGSQTKLLGITALTSLDEVALKAVYPERVKASVSQWAVHLAGLARQAGLYGVVCSAQENLLMRQAWGQSLRLVNPGIRLALSDVQDQKRVLTPQDAIQRGADYLVMGRPILQAPDPVEMVQRITKDIQDAVGLST